MGLRQNQELVARYPVLQFFVYNHLPEELQDISKSFNVVAWRMAKKLPDNEETRVALRKLLEAKDAAVRSMLSYVPTSPDEE